jgi:hypothetical protein
MVNGQGGRGSLSKSLRKYSGRVSSSGFGSILDILGRQGATDPRLMNRNLADIDLQNQMLQRQAQGNLQTYGMGATGGGQALLQAVGQGGATRRADYLGKEAALQEARRRQDLQLMQLLFGPKFQRQGLRNQMAIARLQAEAANQGGGVDIGGLLGGGAQVAGVFT